MVSDAAISSVKHPETAWMQPGNVYSPSWKRKCQMKTFKKRSCSVHQFIYWQVFKLFKKESYKNEWFRFPLTSQPLVHLLSDAFVALHCRHLHVDEVSDSQDGDGAKDAH